MSEMYCCFHKVAFQHIDCDTLGACHMTSTILLDCEQH